MFKKILIFILTITLFLPINIYGADDNTNKEIQALMNLLTYEHDKLTELMDQSFLDAVPIENIIHIIDNFKSNIGELEDVHNKDNGYQLIFQRGYSNATITVNDENKIIGLWFSDYVMKDDYIEVILTEFKNLTGDVSICVKRNGEDVITGVNEDSLMAVGSAFKLYVLKALNESVANDTAAYDDIVVLKDVNKSLPFGILQEWYNNTPVTVKTLANLMIYISDNTATDNLINYIGKRKIEKYITEINKPLLKTKEFFKLKYKADSETLENYLNSSFTERNKILNYKISKMDLDGIYINPEPTLIDEVEWFFTTEELCDVIYELRDCDSIKINPGLVSKEDWYDVGFKGGSEPGVLNYTHLLQKEKNGDIYSVSITINNKNNEVDATSVNNLTSRLIRLIENGKL